MIRADKRLDEVGIQGWQTSHGANLWSALVGSFSFRSPHNSVPLAPSETWRWCASPNPDGGGRHKHCLGSKCTVVSSRLYAFIQALCRTKSINNIVSRFQVINMFWGCAAGTEHDRTVMISQHGTAPSQTLATTSILFVVQPLRTCFLHLFTAYKVRGHYCGDTVIPSVTLRKLKDQLKLCYVLLCCVPSIQ